MTPLDNESEAALIIDARGQRCPKPLLLVRQGLARLASGQRLILLADDPHSPYDLEVYCLRSGHILCGRRDKDGVIALTIEKNKTGGRYN